jgi:hypothetical protein
LKSSKLLQTSPPLHLGFCPPQRLLIAGTDCLSLTVAWEHRPSWNRVGRADGLIELGWGLNRLLLLRSGLPLCLLGLIEVA